MRDVVSLKANDLSVSGIFVPAISCGATKKPLLVAIHGGSYTSSYFDVPGHSLIDRAVAHELSVFVPDRPSYGRSSRLPRGLETIANSASLLSVAIGNLWTSLGQQSSAVFLIGHSVGAAVAVTIAARAERSWPLLGIAISGIGIVPKAGMRAQIRSFPDTDPINPPNELKHSAMFGPVGTFDPRVPRLSDVANHGVPRTEIIDISRNWELYFPVLATIVTVPVHYRLAAHDSVCHVGDDQIAAVRSAFCNSPLVDASIVPNAGHCIDLHHCSQSFHEDQIGFSLRL